MHRSPSAISKIEIGRNSCASLEDSYSQYYHSAHLSSLRHSEHPGLRHIEEEVAYYTTSLERPPPRPLLTFITLTRPLPPCSHILGFLLGTELSTWLINSVPPTAGNPLFPSPPSRHCDSHLISLERDGWAAAIRRRSEPSHALTGVPLTGSPCTAMPSAVGTAPTVMCCVTSAPCGCTVTTAPTGGCATGM